MFQTNATQIVGVTIFAFATLSCLGAFVSAPQRRKIWLAISLGCAALTAEVIWGGRHMIRSSIGNALKDLDIYSGRTGWQIALLVGLLIALLLLLRLFKASTDSTARWATLCMIVLAAFFTIEAISLHSVDAILYTKIGPVLLIGWLWLLLGASISALAWRARRQ